MRKLSLAAFSLLMLGALISGGQALGATVLAVDGDGNATNGIQATSAVTAGKHIVGVWLRGPMDQAKLGGYTVTLKLNNTTVIGNTVKRTNKVVGDFGDPWSEVTNLRDIDASDGDVAISYFTGDIDNQLSVTADVQLCEFEFTTLNAQGSVEITIDQPNAVNITELYYIQSPGNVPKINITSVEKADLGAIGPPALIFPYFPNFDIVNDIELYNETDFAPLAIYLLDGWGAAHKITGQSSTAPWFNPAYFPGKDWICDLELLDAVEAGGAGNESAYMLDRFGAVHSASAEFGNQVYFFDQSGLASVATDFEPYVVNNQVLGGWVLDEFGNVWAVGDAPGAGGAAILSLSLPGRTTDPEINSQGDVNDLYAVDLAVIGNGAGGVVMDSFGILHSFGSASQLGPNLMFGYNIARDLWVNAAGDGAIVLDGFGAIHALGTVDTAGVDAILASSPYFPNLDIARDLEIFQGASDTITGAYILDGYGAIHLTGGAQYPDAN